MNYSVIIMAVIEIWLILDYIVVLLSDGLYVKVQKELLEYRQIMTEAK